MVIGCNKCSSLDDTLKSEQCFIAMNVCLIQLHPHGKSWVSCTCQTVTDLQVLVLLCPDGEVVNTEEHPFGVLGVQPQQQLGILQGCCMKPPSAQILQHSVVNLPISMLQNILQVLGLDLGHTLKYQTKRNADEERRACRSASQVVKDHTRI